MRIQSHVRPRRTLAAVLAAAVATIALLAVATTASAVDHPVSVSGLAFPATTNVTVGDSVTWSNADQVGHTVTADGGAFNGNLAVGGTFSHTFTTAGTFAYHCNIHSNMTGQVVVAAAQTTASPTTGTGGGTTTTPAAPSTGTGGDSSSGPGMGMMLILFGSLAAAAGVGAMFIVRKSAR